MYVVCTVRRVGCWNGVVVETQCHPSPTETLATPTLHCMCRQHRLGLDDPRGSRALADAQSRTLFFHGQLIRRRRLHRPTAERGRALVPRAKSPDLGSARWWHDAAQCFLRISDCIPRSQGGAACHHVSSRPSNIVRSRVLIVAQDDMRGFVFRQMPIPPALRHRSQGRAVFAHPRKASYFMGASYETRSSLPPPPFLGSP